MPAANPGAQKASRERPASDNWPGRAVHLRNSNPLLGSQIRPVHLALYPNMTSAELKQLTHDVQELAGLPLAKRDGIWGTETARAVIKKFFTLGLSLGDPPAAETVPADGSDKVDPRSEGNIATLHMKVQGLARRLVHLAAGAGITIKITSGTRTYAEQDALFNKHDGTTRARGGQSNHNFGLAFDVTIFDGASPVYESPQYKRIGSLGKSLGLSWGGDWQSIEDEPHFELHPSWAANMDETQMLAELRRRHDASIDAFA